MGYYGKRNVVAPEDDADLPEVEPVDETIRFRIWVSC